MPFHTTMTSQFYIFAKMLAFITCALYVLLDEGGVVITRARLSPCNIYILI
jgi:hypothetical protein